MKRLLTIIVFGLSLNSAAQQPGSGNCLAFLQSGNDYVRTANNDAYDTHSQGTFECWVNRNSAAANNGIFCYGTMGSKVSKFSFRINNAGQLVIAFETSTGSARHFGTTTMNLNQWYHIAVTADGSNMLKAYINGVEETLTFNPFFSGASGTEWFGTMGFASTYSHFINIGSSDVDTDIPFGLALDGQLDEVRVWDYPLTQNEIQEKMCQSLLGSEAGLSGYWQMNEGQDGTCAGLEDVCDASGNGYHGTKF